MPDKKDREEIESLKSQVHNTHIDNTHLEAAIHRA